MKRSIRIGKHSIPLWIIVVLLISIIPMGVLADHVWKTIIISMEVKEPLEIVSYPSKLTLFPGEIEEFNVTVMNYASRNYTVILDFSLDNATYQESYVTFSDDIYKVISGQQDLTAWLKVESDAPPINTSLTIDLRRMATTGFSDEFNAVTLDPRWTIVDPDGGSIFDLTANPGWLRITTTSPPGRDLIGTIKVNAPRILQPIYGDFVVETKILSIMDENDEGAGILVWKNSSNYLRLDRMSRTIGHSVEQQVFFCGTINGSFPIPNETQISLPSNINPTYLRIVKSGHVFSGYYSSDGVTWNHVAGVSFYADDPIYIGLAIINEYHSGTFSADFDYFRISG